MSDIVKHIYTRIDSSANWRTFNPVPKNGEQCIEVLDGGLFKLKVGDGETPWVALKYWTSFVNPSINQTILNVSEKYPLESGYYDLESAIQALNLTEDVNLGMMIMFESAKNVWETWQYNGTEKTLYQTPNLWERISQGINYVIFDNNEEGEIKNGGMVTNISVERNQTTENYYQLMTLVYSTKDVITGFNKIENIIIRSSNKSIIGLWNEESRVLDINISPDFIQDLQNKLDLKVDESFANDTDSFVEGKTVYLDSSSENGLIKTETTLVNVIDGTSKVKITDFVSNEKTIKLSYESDEEQSNTNININVDTNNLLIDLGEF